MRIAATSNGIGTTIIDVAQPGQPVVAAHDDPRVSVRIQSTLQRKLSGESCLIAWGQPDNFLESRLRLVARILRLVNTLLKRTRHRHADPASCDAGREAPARVFDGLIETHAAGVVDVQ
ncbi:hypothetical protein [Nocardia sp. NPDC004711]